MHLYGILTSIHLAMVQLRFARACSGGGVGRGEGLDGERLARARISDELRARLDISGHSPSKQSRYVHESPLNVSRFEPSFRPETVSYSSRPKLDFATSRFGTESSPNRDPIFGCVRFPGMRVASTQTTVAGVTTHAHAGHTAKNLVSNPG